MTDSGGAEVRTGQAPGLWARRVINSRQNLVGAAPIGISTTATLPMMKPPGMRQRLTISQMPGGYEASSADAKSAKVTRENGSVEPQLVTTSKAARLSASDVTRIPGVWVARAITRTYGEQFSSIPTPLKVNAADVSRNEATAATVANEPAMGTWPMRDGHNIYESQRAIGRKRDRRLQIDELSEIRQSQRERIDTYR